MSTFQSLMRRADTLRRGETDPVRAAGWTGYIRGLRRAQHGTSFGTEVEHQLYLSAAASDDPERAALWRGYRAGLELKTWEPD